MSSRVYDLNELLEIKKQVLLKKKSIAKEDTQAIKEILKEFMRIQKKKINIIAMMNTDLIKLKKLII